MRFQQTGLLVVAALLLTVSAVRAQLVQMTPKEYAAALHSVSGALDTDRKSGASTAPAKLAPIMRCAVRIDSPPTLVYSDNRAVLAEIRREEAATGGDRSTKLLILRRKIDSIERSVAASPSTDQSQRATSAARQVLLDAQFASDPIPPPGKLEQWGVQVQKWWDEQMRKWFKIKGPTIKDPHINPKVPLAIFILIVTAAVGVLIWYLVGFIRYRTMMPRKQKLESGLAMNEEEAVLVAARDFDKLMELAARHASEGDFRSAFRLVYVASLVALDTDGVVRLNRAKTNWEYLRDLRSGPHASLHDILLPMTRDFDRIWYGFRVATRTDYDRAVGLYSDLRRAGGAIPVGETSAARA